MFRMVRMLLIWLLAFALPAQGVIAATMVFCGPNHHDRAAAATVGHDADAAHQAHDFAAHVHHEAADKQAESTASDETATPDKFAPVRHAEVQRLRLVLLGSRDPRHGAEAARSRTGGRGLRHRGAHHRALRGRRP